MMSDYAIVLMRLGVTWRPYSSDTGEILREDRQGLWNKETQAASAFGPRGAF
jgi:hypothetical protein